MRQWCLLQPWGPFPPDHLTPGTPVNTLCSLNFKATSRRCSNSHNKADWIQGKWATNCPWGEEGGEVTPTFQTSKLLCVCGWCKQSPRQQPLDDELCWTVNKIQWNDEALGTFVSFRFPSLFCHRPQQHSSASSTTSSPRLLSTPTTTTTTATISVSLAERISLQPGRYRGWKPSRDFSAALLDAALNNPRSGPARRHRFYISSKHLYGDRSGFIALSAFYLHQPAAPSKRKTLAQSSAEAFIYLFIYFISRSARPRESRIHFDRKHLCGRTSAPRHVARAARYSPPELRTRTGCSPCLSSARFPRRRGGGWRLIFNFILWNTSVKWVS